MGKKRKIKSRVQVGIVYKIQYWVKMINSMNHGFLRMGFTQKKKIVYL